MDIDILFHFFAFCNMVFLISKDNLSWVNNLFCTTLYELHNLGLYKYNELPKLRGKQ